jgi:4-amino-4-deoxy-L-arabinose transferase-like glycosyltransferase
MGARFLEKISSVPSWKFLVFAVAIYVLLSFSLFLSWSPRTSDEAHFADVARTLSQEGYLGTALVKGLDRHFYLQPPLYFILSALVIRLGGFDITPLRIFSILVGSGVLVILFILGLKVVQDSVAAKIGVFLLALNPNFVTYVKLARMDGLCVLLTLAAVVSYLKVLERPKHSKYLLVGFFCALSVLVHPLGLIGVLGIVLHVTFFENRRKLDELGDVLILLLPLVIGMGCWGYYLLHDPNGFIVQMHFQFLRKARPVLVSFQNFVARYRSIPVLLLLMIASLAYLIVTLIRKSRDRRTIVAILLAVSLVTIGLSFELPYHVYVLPYGSLAVAMLLTAGWRSSSKILSGGSLTVGTLLVVNCLLYFGYLNYVFHIRFSVETDYSKFAQEVSENLAADSKLYLYGFPDLFWGLRECGKGLTYFESVFLDQGKSAEIVKEADYAILTRCFDPSEDEKNISNQLALLKNICAGNGRKLVFCTTVGTVKRFAYSAQIYRLLPSNQP